jgi:hypothetical protein
MCEQRFFSQVYTWKQLDNLSVMWYSPAGSGAYIIKERVPYLNR